MNRERRVSFFLIEVHSTIQVNGDRVRAGWKGNARAEDGRRVDGNQTGKDGTKGEGACAGVRGRKVDRRQGRETV